MKLFPKILTVATSVLLAAGSLAASAENIISQLGSDIDGEAAGDGFWTSVSLSSDGTRVAIGATNNDGNGSSAGHVRVYDWNGTAWVQAGSDIDGEAAYDQSGYSVSLSSDGTRVAIGAATNDGGGSNSGHVRIYDWTNGAWVQAGSDIDGEAANDHSGHSVSLSSDGTRVAIGAARPTTEEAATLVMSGSTTGPTALGFRLVATSTAKPQMTTLARQYPSSATAQGSLLVHTATTEEATAPVMSGSTTGTAQLGFSLVATSTAKPQMTTPAGQWHFLVYRLGHVFLLSARPTMTAVPTVPVM